MSRNVGGAIMWGAAVLLAWPATAHAAEDDLALDLGDKCALDLRRIPKGSFVQGSPQDEAGREPEESTRTVTLTHTYWLGRTPVTRAQFARFVSETRHVTDAEKGIGGWGWDPKASALVQKKDFSWRNPGFPQKEEDPVVLVSFGDATAFTAWASRKTGRRVRLPTEAEFEYGARAGTTTAWYGATKEEDALALGWFKWNAINTTHPVAQKKANPWGLFDVSGNVNQWCRDVYAAYPPGDATDPEMSTKEAVEPERRVLRGGSWLKEPKRGRSAARNRTVPGARNADIGFRVAVEDDPEAARAPEAAPAASAIPSDAGPNVAPPAPPARTEATAWVLVAAPIAASAAAAGWVFGRRRRATGQPRGILTRARADGFWVHAPSVAPRSRMRYTCIIAGVEVAGVVPLDGGEETFVFTGGLPSAIRIEEVVEAPAETYRTSAPKLATAVDATVRTAALSPDATLPIDSTLQVDALASAPEVDEGPPRAY